MAILPDFRPSVRAVVHPSLDSGLSAPFSVFGPIVGATELLEVVDDRQSPMRVRVLMVVLEEEGCGASDPRALRIQLIEHAALPSGRKSSPRTCVDRLTLGVVDQQGHE